MTAPAAPGRLRTALLLSSTGTGVSRFAGALGGLLAARLLGPQGRGQLAILVLFATTIGVGIASGMQFWVLRRVAQTRGLRSVRWIVRTHAVTIIVGSFLAAVAFGPLIAEIAEVGYAPVWCAAAFGAGTALNQLLLALPNGLRAMGVVAVATIAAGVLYAAGNGLLLAVDEPSITLVIVSGVFGMALGIAVLLAWSRHAATGIAEVARGPDEYRRALRFAWPAGLGEFVLLAMLRVDVLIVAAFLPLREVGLYAVAVALTEVLWIVPDGIALVVLPTTARDVTQSRTARLLALAIALTASAGILLAIFDVAILDLAFGSAFRDASAAVPWLVIAALGAGVWKIVGAEVIARGRTLPRLTSALVGLVAMVCVDVVAVPSAGIAGAGLGSAVGYAAAAAIVVVAWRRIARVDGSTLLVLDEHGEGSLGAGEMSVS